MKKLSFLILLLFMAIQSNAQQVIPLYSGTVPGSKKAPADFKETTITGNDGVTRVSRVFEPTLTVYTPEKPNGTAVIICPGGGYSILAIKKEGFDVAKKFAEAGVTAFVLKYRLPNDTVMVDKSLAPLQDALQAMYLVRKNASVWGVNINKVGIMGFSAGGHLASTLSVHYNDMKIENRESISLRPDFSVLIYPVISFGTITHAGSVSKLLGNQPTPAQKSYFSNQNYVNAQTPPTFLVHANNDLTVPVRNSLLYNEKLASAQVPAEMHIYQAGGHGFGLNNKTSKEDWFQSLKNWMIQNSWL
ncbi:MAG: alpha/beta hydrolase [Flavobacteriales bacterium]|nr:MAG: alpha/beta hydrolase [Flavobacteriales bacterium]